MRPSLSIASCAASALLAADGSYSAASSPNHDGASDVEIRRQAPQPETRGRIRIEEVLGLGRRVPCVDLKYLCLHSVGGRWWKALGVALPSVRRLPSRIPP